MTKGTMSNIKSCVLAAAGIALCLLAGCQRVTGSGQGEFVLKNEKTDMIKTQGAGSGPETEVMEGSETADAAAFDGASEDALKPASGETSDPRISRIVCWGDSLTYGEGGEGVTFPSVLAEHLPDVEVINYGIQGETARQIAIRTGLLPMTVSAFTIPEDQTPAEVSLWQGGEDPVMMRLGDRGINPCTIGGVEGTLSYRPEDEKYYFTRARAGEAVEVEEGTQVFTYGDRDKSSSDVIVLFAGSNRAPDRNTVQELIGLERQILDYIGSDRYVVMGLTSKALAPDVAEVNKALQEAFGEHFLDIRKYLLEHGLEDAGMTATDQDLADIENGEIPSQLRVDVVHGNPAFYKLMGEQVYQKLRELGYCP